MVFLPFINKWINCCPWHVPGTVLSSEDSPLNKTENISALMQSTSLCCEADETQVNKHHLIVRSSTLRIKIGDEAEDHGDLFRFKGEGRSLWTKPGGR